MYQFEGGINPGGPDVQLLNTHPLTLTLAHRHAHTRWCLIMFFFVIFRCPTCSSIPLLRYASLIHFLCRHTLDKAACAMRIKYPNTPHRAPASFFITARTVALGSRHSERNISFMVAISDPKHYHVCTTVGACGMLHTSLLQPCIPYHMDVPLHLHLTSLLHAPCMGHPPRLQTIDNASFDALLKRCCRVSMQPPLTRATDAAIGMRATYALLL